jgi:ABC-type multidrug transport system permease subunit
MDKLPVPQPDRESYLKHRRDMTRQILVPIILVTVIGLGFVALSIYGAVANSSNVSLWADISLIWLIIPMMFLALVILGLVGGMVYGLAKLLGVTPRYTGLAQQYALWLNAEIVLWTDKIIQPVLSLKTWLGMFSREE